MNENESLEVKRPTVDSKRCPHCFAELLLDAERCPACLEKVGKAGRDGRAKELIDWRAYGTCIFAWVFFAWVVWYGFFRD
jgi:hypothetical protein